MTTQSLLAVAPARSRSLTGLSLDVAGMLALVALAYVNLHRFDPNWDSVAYHIPFAALRTGLMRHSAFGMGKFLDACYQGFPPLADWVQGAMWRLTGRVEATQLVSPIAVGAFALYARWAIGLRVAWSVLIVASIPIMLTALNSANVDVWSNAFFSIFLLAAFRLLRHPSANWAWHTILGAAALGIAVNSKMQFFVVGGAALAIYGAASLALLWRDRRLPAKRRDRARSLALMLALSPLLFLTPIRNAIAFHNPVYPFVVQALGVTLPGTQINVWVGPRRLANLRQPERYALSQLDFDAINGRNPGFNLDQGNQSEGADGNRMGGALAVVLIGSVGALAIGLRRRRLTSMDVVLLVAAACLLAVVIAFPGSSELRYFCFVNLIVSVAALTVVTERAASGDGYCAGLRAGLLLLFVGGAVFASMATGLRQLGSTDARTLDEVRRDLGANTELAVALGQSATICYIRQDSNAMLLSPLLNPIGQGRVYRIEQHRWDVECPVGSAIIR